MAELALGHAKRGMVKQYDHYEFADELREVLQRWARHLADLVSPPPFDDGKVVRMRA